MFAFHWNNVKWAATFHKKSCVFSQYNQTTHTEKQINWLKPLKHMALCLIHNKQNISPICCRRAKRRVRKFENESLLWFALYSVTENGWAYVLVFNLSAYGVITFLFTITRVLSVSMTTRSITCLQGSSLENSHQANKLWKASRDTAKYKHNCISLHKATPNYCTNYWQTLCKAREREKKEHHLMKKPWLVGAHWTRWLEIR